jgi:PleD family two-component response regulator
MGVLGYALRKIIARDTRSRLLAFTDALTGLANRRRFGQCFEREWTRAVTSGKPLAFVSSATLIDAADAALYEAKRQGRNRTIGLPQAQAQLEHRILKRYSGSSTCADVRGP